ncbi:hypothetical protein QUA30_09455 [Microcoleus sp. Pol14C2]|uniref:hypothetical protein n=1 Tax=unclassified Microcoleus TaxID=2642155 RepID=UPI002FCFBF1D
MAFPQDWRSWETQIARLIGQAWLDEALYNRLLNEPAATLRDNGLILEDFVEVQVNQAPDAVPILRGTSGETVIYVLPLPLKPDDLTDEQISNWIDGRAEILPGGLRVCCS